MPHTAAAINMSTKMKRDALMQNLRGSRSGYTLVELLIVMLIASILMSMVVPQFTRMMTTRNAQNARDDLVWMAVRAKAKAVERGQTYMLEINPTTERAWKPRFFASTVSCQSLMGTRLGVSQTYRYTGWASAWRASMIFVGPLCSGEAGDRLGYDPSPLHLGPLGAPRLSRSGLGSPRRHRPRWT